MCNVIHILYVFQPGARRPRHAPGFLKLILCGSSVCMFVCACVCVCPPMRLLITSGVIWRDMNLIQLVKKFYSCYMAHKDVFIIITACCSWKATRYVILFLVFNTVCYGNVRNFRGFRKFLNYQ